MQISTDEAKLSSLYQVAIFQKKVLSETTNYGIKTLPKCIVSAEILSFLLLSEVQQFSTACLLFWQISETLRLNPIDFHKYIAGRTQLISIKRADMRGEFKILDWIRPGIQLPSRTLMQTFGFNKNDFNIALEENVTVEYDSDDDYSYRSCGGYDSDNYHNYYDDDYYYYN